MTTPLDQEDRDLWLFGYGSLIWKPPPHFDKRVPGYIEGYVRRFWQSSEDHRGTPDSPGRVVTLIPRAHWETLTDQHPTAPPRVWGAAYRIPARHVREVKAYLDIREVNGYSVEYAAFHAPSSSPTTCSSARAAPSSGQTEGRSKNDTITCLVYIGLPCNPQFLGPQDPQALAEHIVRSRGPSGENSEYLYMLAEALGGLEEEAGVCGGVDAVDEHVADLASRVREVEARLGRRGVNSANGGGEVFERRGECGVERIEEVEK